MFFNFFQRLFDLLFVIITSPIWISVLMLFSITNYIFLGSPVFFIQSRIGKNGCEFNLFKLRSMINDETLPEVNCIPSYGKFIRRTSIDELPQLLNVLMGDISLVGPRPLPIKILNQNLTDIEFIHRSSVKPGLTGYSQIHSKGEKREFRDKFQLDIKYISEISLKMYFLVLIKTFKVVFIRFIHNKNGETL